MHRTAWIGVMGIVAAMLLLAVGAWAYDASQDDRIAPGVTIGGVDVGGLNVEEARGIVRSEVVAPLSRPVTVSFRDQEYRLTPKQLRQRADIDGMLDEAVEVSRDGGLVTRLGRYVSGGEVDAEVEARVSYDDEAVDRFVEKLGDEIDRDPVDASIVPSGDELSPTPGKDGLAVRAEWMRDRIVKQVESPVGERSLRAGVRRIEPEVTTKELAKEYPTYITIDRANFTLRLFKKLKLVKKYSIAVGQVGYDTPEGEYSIQSKQVNPYWYVPDSDWAGDLAGTVVPPGPDNPLQARWMGIFDGAGIHGTNEPGSIGTAASHGCIRMLIPEVIELYDKVEVGTPVYIG
jgi:hypothetical protein